MADSRCLPQCQTQRMSLGQEKETCCVSNTFMIDLSITVNFLSNAGGCLPPLNPCHHVFNSDKRDLSLNSETQSSSFVLTSLIEISDKIMFKYVVGVRAS